MRPNNSQNTIGNKLWFIGFFLSSITVAALFITIHQELINHYLDLQHNHYFAYAILFCLVNMLLLLSFLVGSSLLYAQDLKSKPLIVPITWAAGFIVLTKYILVYLYMGKPSLIIGSPTFFYFSYAEIFALFPYVINLFHQDNFTLLSFKRVMLFLLLVVVLDQLLAIIIFGIGHQLLADVLNLLYFNLLIFAVTGACILVTLLLYWLVYPTIQPWAIRLQQGVAAIIIKGVRIICILIGLVILSLFFIFAL